MRYLLMLALALAPGLAHAQYASSCQLLAPTVPVVRAPQVQHVPYAAPQKNLAYQPVAYAQNQQQYAQPVQHAQQSAPQQYAQNLAPYSNQVAQKNVNQYGPNVKNVQQQFGQLGAGYQQKAAAYQKTQQIAGAYAPQAIYYEQQVLLPAYDHEYSFASGLASYQKGFGHPAPAMGYGHDPSNLATKDDLLAVAKSIEKLAESLAGNRPEPVPDDTDSAAAAQVKRGEKLLLVRCHTCHVKKPKLAQFADTAGTLLPLSDKLREDIVKKTFNSAMPPPQDADGNKIEPLTDAEYADLKAFVDPENRWNPSRP